MLSRFPIMGEQAVLEILVVKIFDLVIHTNFNDAVEIIIIRSQAVSEIEFMLVEFDAVTRFVVEIF